MSKVVGVVTERVPGERRVALVAASLPGLAKLAREVASDAWAGAAPGPGARLRAGGRRGGPAGDRDGAEARRDGRGLRHAAGGQGAGAEPRRALRRAAAGHRRRRRAGPGRVRARAVGRVLSTPAGDAGR